MIRRGTRGTLIRRGTRDIHISVVMLAVAAAAIVYRVARDMLILSLYRLAKLTHFVAFCRMRELRYFHNYN